MQHRYYRPLSDNVILNRIFYRRSFLSWVWAKLTGNKRLLSESSKSMRVGTSHFLLEILTSPFNALVRHKFSKESNGIIVTLSAMILILLFNAESLWMFFQVFVSLFKGIYCFIVGEKANNLFAPLLSFKSALLYLYMWISFVLFWYHYIACRVSQNTFEHVPNGKNWIYSIIENDFVGSRFVEVFLEGSIAAAMALLASAMGDSRMMLYFIAVSVAVFYKNIKDRAYGAQFY